MKRERKRKSRHPVRNTILILLLMMTAIPAGAMAVMAIKQKYTVVWQGYAAYEGSITDEL